MNLRTYLDQQVGDLSNDTHCILLYLRSFLHKNYNQSIFKIRNRQEELASQDCRDLQGESSQRQIWHSSCFEVDCCSLAPRSHLRNQTNHGISSETSNMAAQALSSASLLSSSRNVSIRGGPRRSSRVAVRPFAAHARQVG